MIKKSFKKFFTLIELIVVIVVLGVLAAIVIPNISSFKEEAKETALVSDTRNIQTAVDMFMLDNNGDTPTKEKAILGNPKTLEIYGLYPEYVRDLPKNKEVHWWLDYSETVWSSYVDAPRNVKYDNSSTKLSWDAVEGANLYKIYKVELPEVSSSLKRYQKLELVRELNAAGSNTEIQIPFLKEGIYLVSAVDNFGFETVAISMNADYQGYLQPDKDYQENMNFEYPSENLTSLIGKANILGNSVGNRNNGGFFSEQGEWIYFRNPADGNSLYKMKHDHSQKIKLTTESVTYIEVLGEWIYYIEGGGRQSIMKIKIDGRNKTELFSGQALEIVVVGDTIYYVNSSDNYSIYSMKTDGSSIKKLNTDNSSNLNVNNANIYYRNNSDGYTIYKINLDGSRKVKLTSVNSHQINVSEGGIFYLNAADLDYAYRMNLDGTESKKLYSNRMSYLNLIGDWIYYSNRSDNQYLYKIKKDGTNNQKLSETKARKIHLIGDKIYFLEPSENVWKQIDQDGLNLKNLD